VRHAREIRSVQPFLLRALIAAAANKIIGLAKRFSQRLKMYITKTSDRLTIIES
jgi:hypothetical protein